MIRKVIAYYLPFDTGLMFRLPWIWKHAKSYAYRNAIACLALSGISLSAKAYDLSSTAMAFHLLTLVAAFFATVFTAAAFDRRFR